MPRSRKKTVYATPDPNQVVELLERYGFQYYIRPDDNLDILERARYLDKVRSFTSREMLIALKKTFPSNIFKKGNLISALNDWGFADNFEESEALFNQSTAGFVYRRIPLIGIGRGWVITPIPSSESIFELRTYFTRKVR